MHANCSFLPISERNIQKMIIHMDSSKAYQKYNIPPKILKQNDGKFPNNLKNADITPTFK